MHLQVEGDRLSSAAGHLEVRALLARSRLGDCAAVPSGLRDPALHEGVRLVADVLADVLELVAQDLELLSTKVRAGATVYDRVEGSLVR